MSKAHPVVTIPVIIPAANNPTYPGSSLVFHPWYNAALMQGRRETAKKGHHYLYKF